MRTIDDENGSRIIKYRAQFSKFPRQIPCSCSGSDAPGFLASDLAAEPRVFTEQGRPSDDTEERSMEAVTVAPEEPSAAVRFNGLRIPTKAATYSNLIAATIPI